MDLFESTSSPYNLPYNISQHLGHHGPILFAINESTIEGSPYLDKEVLLSASESNFKNTTNSCTPLYLFESKTVQFWMKLIIIGILTTAVAGFGILGNILSISVLSMKKMQSSISILMLGLSVSDLIICLNTTFVIGINQIVEDSKIQMDEYLRVVCEHRRFIFPFVSVAVAGSTYFTVAIAIERYIAVCWPIQCRSYITKTKAYAVSAFIVLFCFAISTPNFVIYYFTKEPEKFDYAKRSCKSSEAPRNVSKLISYIIFMYALPISVITVVNVLILLKIRKMNVRRDSMTPYQRRKITLTNMLITIVAVYLFCNIARVSNEIIKQLSGTTYVEVVTVTNFLVTLNSSVNYLIYCAFGKTFRQSFVNLFFKCGNPPCNCTECSRTGSAESEQCQNQSQSPFHVCGSWLAAPFRLCCTGRRIFPGIKNLIPKRSQQYDVSAT